MESSKTRKRASKKPQEDIAALTHAVAATSLKEPQKSKDATPKVKDIEPKAKDVKPRGGANEMASHAYPHNASAWSSGGNRNGNAQAQNRNAVAGTTQKNGHQNANKKNETARKEPCCTPRQAKKFAEQQRNMADERNSSQGAANSGWRQTQHDVANGQNYAANAADGGWQQFPQIPQNMANSQGIFNGSANGAWNQFQHSNNSPGLLMGNAMMGWPQFPHSMANGTGSTAVPANSGQHQFQGSAANGQGTFDATAYGGWRQFQRNPDASYSSGQAGSPSVSIATPMPTPAYLAQAMLEPFPRPTTQPLLIILDLNGTILRKNRRHGTVPCTATMRPHADAFLKWLFEESNHTVMVWSSITPKNVNELVSKHIPAQYANQLAAVWARNTLRLSEKEYMANGPVYKRLEWVWQSPVIQQRYPFMAAMDAMVPFELHNWGQHNTILIDDSSLKAATQPFNHIQIPEFVQMSQWTFPEDKISVLDQVKTYLQAIAMWSDISQRVSRDRFSLLT